MTQDTNVYTSFHQNDDIVNNITNRVTYGLWSDNVGELTTFFTASNQTATSGSVGKYYHDVYSTASSGSAQVEFSVAYGHVYGSGSLNGDLDYTTKAIYDQYRNLLLKTKSELFTLADNTELTHALFISINRNNLKQSLDAGNWELHLSGSSGNKYLTLVDDSGDDADINPLSINTILNVVSGTVGGATGSTYFGLVYRDYGIIVLDPDSIGVTTFDSGNDAYHDNHGVLFNAIKTGKYFSARSEEKISSTHYFCRVKNKEYNYSDNVTFYSGSSGDLIYTSFINDPHTFITTVGLYNNNNDLLAIAKLSQPVEKSFSNEVLLKIRLDF